MKKLFKNKELLKVMFSEHNMVVAPDGTKHYQTIVDKCHINELIDCVIALSNECEANKKEDLWPYLELSPSGSWMGNDRVDGAIYIDYGVGPDSKKHLLLAVNRVLFD